MTVRSLSEAAADVLSRSQASADKEPMKKLPGNSWQDLGGATPTDDYSTKVQSGQKDEDESVGQATTKNIKQTAKPGPAPKIGSMPMQRIAGSVAEEAEEDEDYEDVEHDEDEDEDESVSLDERRSLIRAKMQEMSCAEDVDAMFSGQELSEEFKQRVTTIFEAAVIARAVAVVEELEEQILESAAESVEEIKLELEEQMSAYASYVAKEWLAENQLAVDAGLKSEIMEEFIDGLRGLFVEHNINIPDEEVDVVEAMAEEVAELQEQLNAALNVNVELMEAINEATKESIIYSVCEGLTATQAEKVKTLAEGVEFTTEGEYQDKVELIRESYFNQKVKQTNVQSSVAVKEVLAEQSSDYTESMTSPLMEKYVSAISRTLIK
jgi:roadblock/LC7 domain-containing protein